jgi:hypothetical protein
MSVAAKSIFSTGYLSKRNIFCGGGEGCLQLFLRRAVRKNRGGKGGKKKAEINDWNFG